MTVRPGCRKLSGEIGKNGKKFLKIRDFLEIPEICGVVVAEGAEIFFGVHNYKRDQEKID